MRKCVVDAGMDHQRLRVADVGQVREELQRLDEACGPARASPLMVEAEHRAAAARQQALARARGRDATAARDSRPTATERVRRRGTRRSCARSSTCRSMRSGSVSMPCRIWNAVNGAMHAPKSRMPSRRARSRNARGRRLLGEHHVVEALRTARSASGTCRATPSSQSKRARSRRARRRSPRRGPTGTWSPSGRRGRRRARTAASGRAW